jgi:hypothetical protein
MSVCNDRGWFTGRLTAFYKVYWLLVAWTEISMIDRCEWDSENDRGQFQDSGFQTFVVFWMLGGSPASEFYVPTFRNTQFIFIGADTTYEDGTDIVFRNIGT